MTKIVIDSFFHQMPGHRLSRNISVGGYTVNVGRYSPYDVYHPNGISMLFSDLIENYDVSYSNEPFSEMSLCGADILIVPNPDYPMYQGAAAYRLDHYDVDAMMNFLRRGGSILMLVNSFLQKSDFWEENFDYERVSPYFRKLGVTWDPDYMSDADHILPAKSGRWTVGYGQGGRVDGALPEDAQELLSWNGEIYGFLKKVGKGTAAVIGDAGLVSNGLYGFPGFDNRAFIRELIARLTPDFGAAPETFERLDYGCLSCATREEGVSESLFRTLRRDAEFQVDHHYRHLVWENPSVPVDAAQVRLPFSLEAVKNNRAVEVTLPYLPIQKGREVGTVSMALNVAKTVRGTVEEYLVSGTKFSEDASWEDIGADPVAFGEIGALVRVNTVAQYLLGVENGHIKWASCKQGQIVYDRNLKNVHYGYDIVLNSSCTVYAPVAR